jgi:hypothetical protein
MKHSLIHVGMLIGALWCGTTALAADPSGAPQHVAGRGFEAWLQTDGSVCLSKQTSSTPDAPSATCNSVAGLRDIVQIAALGPHLVGRQADGRVWAWQPYGLLQPRPIQGLHDKVTDMGLGVDGDLWLSLRGRAPSPGSDVGRTGPAAVRLVSMARAGQVDLVRAPLPERSTLARAAGVPPANSKEERVR